MRGRATKVMFRGGRGELLSASLEQPEGSPAAFALFAHCFTCSKDVAAASRISRRLAELGIAVVRFDFTGLGNSEGDYSNTNFSSNVDDLVAAAGHMRSGGIAPTLLVGHSLGGAAVIAAARRIPEARSVVTIGAPSRPKPVLSLLEKATPAIDQTGSAAVTLAGRTFLIRKQLLEDLAERNLADCLQQLGRALLVIHAPSDEIVPIDEAHRIFEHARHPKSFVSLDGADHLLGEPADSEYAARVVATWVSRYVRTARKFSPATEFGTIEL